MMLLASTGYCIGYHVSIMNSMGGLLLDDVYKVRPEDRFAALGNLNFFYAVGATLSQFVGGYIFDYFGRQRVPLLADAAVILLSLVMMVENFTILLIARFLIGFVSTTYTMHAAVAFVETFPPALAGLGTMINYSAVTFFILLTFI